MASVDEILENAAAGPTPAEASPDGRPPHVAAGGPSPLLVLALAFLAGVAAARFLSRRADAGSRG